MNSASIMQGDSLYGLYTGGELAYNTSLDGSNGWSSSLPDSPAALMYRSPHVSGSGTEVDGPYQYSGSAQASLVFDHGVFSAQGSASATTNNLDALATTVGVSYARFQGDWLDTLTVSGLPVNTPVDLLFTMTLKSKTGGDKGLDSSASTIDEYAYITPSPESENLYLATRNGSGDGLQTASSVVHVVAGTPLQLTNLFFVDADANSWQTYGELDPPNGPLAGIKAPLVNEYIDAPDATSLSIQVLTPGAELTSASGLDYSPEADVPEPSSFYSILLILAAVAGLRFWAVFRPKASAFTAIALFALLGLGWQVQADPLYGVSSSGGLQLLSDSDPNPMPGWDSGGYLPLTTYHSPLINQDDTINNSNGYQYVSGGTAQVTFDRGSFVGTLQARASTTDDRYDGNNATISASGMINATWKDTLTVSGPSPGTPVSLKLTIVMYGGTTYNDLTLSTGSLGDYAELQNGNANAPYAAIYNTLDSATDHASVTYQVQAGDVLQLQNSLSAFAYADTATPYSGEVWTSAGTISENSIPTSLTIDVLTPGASFTSASGLTYDGTEQTPEPAVWSSLLLGALTIWMVRVRLSS